MHFLVGIIFECIILQEIYLLPIEQDFKLKARLAEPPATRKYSRTGIVSLSRMVHTRNCWKSK